jgi:two-component system cell cycle sensor histidine kinase/response regulator CckA
VRVRVVTQLNRFKRQLAEQQRFNRVIELAPDAIVILDRSQQILFVNRAAESVFRSSEELELDGTHFPMLLLGSEEEVSSRFEKILAGGATDRLKDVAMLRLDGEEILTDINVGGFTWNDQPALLLILRDVTEQRLLESRMLRMQRLDSLGAIAGNVAHDLNNVMTPIILAAQSLSRQSLDAETTRLLGTVIDSARHGSDIVQQILTFTRGGVGASPQNLREVINTTAGIFSETLPDDVYMKTSLCEESLVTRANPSELQQLLGNLITNAIEAMPGGGELKLTLDRADPDHARITITDSGVGIPPEHLARMGEPFFTTKAGGTGLGFASVKKIIQRLGGEVAVRSRTGQGTEITLLLPTHQRSLEEVEETSGLENLTGRTVLFTEADAAVRQLTVETLECLGCRVLTAGDGPECVSVYRRNARAVEVVLCARSLPSLSGPEVFERLKKVRSDVRFILIDGSGKACHVDRAAVLAKPYGRTELLRAISAAVTPTHNL